MGSAPSQRCRMTARASHEVRILKAVATGTVGRFGTRLESLGERVQLMLMMLSLQRQMLFDPIRCWSCRGLPDPAEVGARLIDRGKSRRTWESVESNARKHEGVERDNRSIMYTSNIKGEGKRACTTNIIEHTTLQCGRPRNCPASHGPSFNAKA